ncbi:MAG: hypothetical protein AAGG55_14625 [Pseudomonadota bacterium]
MKDIVRVSLAFATTTLAGTAFAHQGEAGHWHPETSGMLLAVAAVVGAFAAYRISRRMTSNASSESANRKERDDA